MNVTFLPQDKRLASTRLRQDIPRRALSSLGVGEGSDWLIVSKHNWPPWVVEPFERVCFDICDDHFHDQHERHYRKWCDKADLITCNSLVMQDIIKAETGRDAWLIHDPYEQPLKAPKVHRPPLWFGHASNLDNVKDLLEIEDLIVVTNVKHPRVICWSPEVMDRMYERAGIVLIPTGKNLAKSANRAIDAIRRGMYPCTGIMPAYTELGLGSDDVIKEMNDRLNDTDWTLKRIADLQELVEFRFNPLTIGKEWLKALSS